MTSVWSPSPSPRPGEPLDGDTTADVVVVGAGLSGLWTAYYLLEADAALDVLVVDAGAAGTGAALTGIGACTPDLRAPVDRLVTVYGDDGARDLRAALRDAVVEVGGVLGLEEVDCGFAFGGEVRVARNAAQVGRLTSLVDEGRAWGDEWRLLEPTEVAEHVASPGVLAGAWTADCAVLDPARLLAGLVEVLRGRGVRFAEQTATVRVSPRAVVTDRGIVRAPRIVVAAETDAAAGSPSLAAVPTLGLATDALDAAAWDRIGLAPGVLVADLAHLAVCARRTDDDRLVLTATGTRPDTLRAALVAMFPPATGTRELTWSGTNGVTRDGLPHVTFDEASGIGLVPSFNGAEIAAANLAGRTIADLATGDHSDLTRLAWVGAGAPAWGRSAPAQVALALRAAAWADSAESLDRTPRTARQVLERFPIV